MCGAAVPRYFETDDSFKTAAGRMEATPVNSRWQEVMSKYTVAGGRPDENFHVLEPYFYLGSNREDCDHIAEKDGESWSAQATTAGSGLTRAGLRRQCFTMRFATENISQYLEDHRCIWPEMQQALVDCGWHNYSLFYRADGLAVGYVHTVYLTGYSKSVR